MTDRGKLIEAFKSKASEWDSYAFDSDWDYSPEAAILADIALAVFEKAHTPTNDERVALARIVRRVIDSAYTFEGDLDPSVDEILIRELLTAGFRRPVQGEPTDAQVEAGCVAFYEHATGLTSWARLAEYDAVIANRYREGVRRALCAAAAVREEGKP